MMPYIDTIAGVITGSLKELSSVLGIVDELDIEEVSSELIKLRELY